MFIILAPPAAAGASSSSVYVALACAGAYAVLYRLAVVFMWSRVDGVPRTPATEIVPFMGALKNGWRSPLIFLGIIIPVMVTIGPLAWRGRSRGSRRHQVDLDYRLGADLTPVR